MEKRTVSLCTVSMNRLEHVKRTLERNIEDNIDYEKVEFVLLDYNSQDNLEEWVNTHLKKYVDAGILIYYRTTLPRFFRMSHSKNLAARLASGDIICNIDADNYTGKGFAAYINARFSENENIIITGNNPEIADLGGRICVAREDFLQVRGYDEAMQGYGWEDIDFTNRVLSLGKTLVRIDNRGYLGFIPHSDEERLSNYEHKGIEHVYLGMKSYYESVFAFLFRDGRYEVYIIEDNFAKNGSSIEAFFNPFLPRYRYFFQDAYSYVRGKWTKDGLNIQLMSETGSMKLLEKSDGGLLDRQENLTYLPINDMRTANRVLKFAQERYNLFIMRNNEAANRLAVNPEGFGTGIVSRNFREEPITV